MARAREEVEWGRLSNLMALIRNVVVGIVDGKARIIEPHQFNPFSEVNRKKKEIEDESSKWNEARKMIERNPIARKQLNVR